MVRTMYSKKISVPSRWCASRAEGRGNVVCARRPERAEKSQKVCLLFVVKRLDKRIACLLRLSTVERNRLGEGQRSPIVEVGGGIGHAPQPGGGELRGQLFSE